MHVQGCDGRTTLLTAFNSSGASGLLMHQP
jgi:hypothetical protein